MSWFKTILGAISNITHTLITGGPYETIQYSAKERKYAAAKAQKDKDFTKYGGTPCKVCSKRIPGNKSYCAPCYFKYIKK